MLTKLVTKAQVHELLLKFAACQDAVDWHASASEDQVEAWAQCPRGEWLIWIAGRVGVSPYVLADLTVRTLVSLAFDFIGLPVEAVRFRELPKIVDAASASRARYVSTCDIDCGTFTPRAVAFAYDCVASASRSLALATAASDLSRHYFDSRAAATSAAAAYAYACAAASATHGATSGHVLAAVRVQLTWDLVAPSIARFTCEQE